MPRVWQDSVFGWCPWHRAWWRKCYKAARKRSAVYGFWRMLGLPWGGQTAKWYAERLRRAGKPAE